MDEEYPNVVFRSSRAKLLPLVIFIPTPMVLFGVPVLAFSDIVISGQGHGGEWLVLFVMATLFLFFAFAWVVAISGLIKPDTLVISHKRVSIRRRFGSRSYTWRQLGEAKKKYISFGRGSSLFIEIPLSPAMADKPLLIPAESYIQPPDVIFETISTARSGQPLVQPPEKTPKAFAYFAVPAMLLATLAFFGAVAGMVLRVPYS